MARICLLTTGQPSTQPRLVKEADALAQIGHDVVVVCGWWVAWADRMDRLLLGQRAWRCVQVGGQPEHSRRQYLWSRLRHGASRRSALVQRFIPSGRLWALARPAPELLRAVRQIPADLYIAHNLGALPAAVEAARHHGARVGFDAEDFHSGMASADGPPSRGRELASDVELGLIPRCDYVTAAAPGIAEAYANELNIPKPIVILNVFPLCQRPATLRRPNPGDPVRLYWFSQIIGPNRGLEDVVRALGRSGRKDVELHLRGRWSDGFRDGLLRMGAAAGLSADRIVAHAPGPPDEMIRLAAAYDVGLALEHPVSVNRDVCLTNKIFTYLLAGSAVVATATRGQRALMDAIPGAGFCYELGAVDALADQLRLWCENRNDLLTRRRNAWDWGTRRYNWDQEEKTFVSLIEDVLQKPPRSVSEAGRKRLHDPAALRAVAGARSATAR